jgi:hypothetical protein
MKHIPFVFFTLLFFIPLNIIAEPYDMILAGDPILEDIRFLSLESGKSFLSFTVPLAPDEIKKFLDRIDVSLLSTPAREAFDRIEERLNPKTPLSLSWDDFSVFFNINATFEASARLNTDISWEPANTKIPDFISLPIRFFFVDTLQLYIDPAVSIDPYDFSTNGYYTDNHVFFGNNINGNSPLRAFAAAGGSWWNFQLGRDRLAYGTGISGNLAITDNPPFYEFMRFSAFSKYFKYSMLINHTPLKLDEKLYPKINNLDDEALKETMQRYFYLHRVDFTLFDVLSVGLMEGVIVGNSALELRFLNPFLIFHNAMTWRDYGQWQENETPGAGNMNGSFFSVEINWNITKSLAAYGQFVMNELSIGPELEGDRLEPPNAVGFMAGIQFTHSFNTWASLFFLESIYTTPYLYLNGSPFASFIFMHDVEFVHEEYYYYYFGYPRDTFALTAGSKFFKGDRIIISGEFSWIAKGEHDKDGLTWDWQRTEEAFNESPLFGIIQNKFILSAGVQWKPLSFLDFKAKVSGIVSINNNHTSGVNETGGQVSLSAGFHF